MRDRTGEMIAILRHNGRASYSEIARELGTNRDYVASRIGPMLKTGELRVVAGIHPRLLGLNVSAHLSIHTCGNTQQVLDSLQELPAPVLISLVTGESQIVVELYLPTLTELQHQVSLIRSIHGIRDVAVHLHERIFSSFFIDAGAETLTHFDDIDRRIVGRLLRDGRANLVEIAETGGLSISACRTRVQKLIDSGAIQIGAIKQCAQTMNELLFGIGLNVRGLEREALDVLEAHPGTELVARSVGRFDLLAMIEFPSLVQFNSLVSQLRALASVEHCEHWLHVQIVRRRYLRASAPLTLS